jgi:hypothetical protein
MSIDYNHNKDTRIFRLLFPVAQLWQAKMNGWNLKWDSLACAGDIRRTKGKTIGD